MRGLGTLINCLAILLGGLTGLFGGNKIQERYQQSLLRAVGVCVIMLAIAGAMEKMLSLNSAGTLVSSGSLLMIVSMALGSLLGEFLDIEGLLERFGAWLKRISRSQGDTRFVDGFLTSSLTVCVGAMAVVGAIQDGIYGDHSVLFAKALLDMIIIAVLSASLGRGCVFSLVPVGLFQGSITLLAVWLQPLLSRTALDALGMVGSVLIFCVGINLVWGKMIGVANMLPALLFAMLLSVWL